MIPLLGLINLLEQLTEFWKTVNLLNYWFIMKEYNSAIARWKRRIGQKGCGASVPFSQHLYLWSFLSPILLHFYGGFLLGVIG